jgi:hypothetical protein
MDHDESQVATVTLPYAETFTGETHLGVHTRVRCLAMVGVASVVAAMIAGSILSGLFSSRTNTGGTDSVTHSCGTQPAVDVTTGAEFSISILPPLPNFTNMVFCGHLVPDADAAASAIAGALIFDGVATLPAAPNTETRYLLDRFEIESPALVSDVYIKGQVALALHHYLAYKSAALHQRTHPIINDCRVSFWSTTMHSPKFPRYF